MASLCNLLLCAHGIATHTKVLANYHSNHSNNCRHGRFWLHSFLAPHTSDPHMEEKGVFHGGDPFHETRHWHCCSAHTKFAAEVGERGASQQQCSSKTTMQMAVAHTAAPRSSLHPFGILFHLLNVFHCLECSSKLIQSYSSNRIWYV